MTKRSAKRPGISARLGALFGVKKPVKHAVPHIYISTEQETTERRVKAKARSAKERLARESVTAAAAATAPIARQKRVGKLLKHQSSDDAALSSGDVSAIQNEDGFMKKVIAKKDAAAPRAGVGLWSMMRDRFARSAPPPVRPSPEKVEQIDLKGDSFLQHARVGPSEPVIRTEGAFPANETVAPTSALDEAAMPVEAPVQRKDRAAPTNEVAVALKENSDIVAAAPAPAPVVRPKEKAPATKKAPAPKFQTQSGLKAFMTSLNYIGMGKERLMFIQNLATMLNAGLSLIESLKTLMLETRNKQMRKLLARIIDAVENGSPLWRAMEAQSFFSLHALALVRIGEDAGNLAENMAYLADQDEKDHALRSKVKMAMLYPSIVMVIMFIIVVGLGMFVLPNLVGVLFSLNVKLPLITRIVIWFSDAFVAYGAVGVPSFIVAFFLLIILSTYTSFRVVTQWVMFRIPGIGVLAKEATIARFGVILGGLLKAGVPVIEALESLVQVTPIASYKRLYAELLAHVAIGDSFQKSFASIKKSEKLLPPSVQQLVITGEKSGSLADIMLKVADIYDKKATETAQKLPIILEPILLLFIGSLVGSIAFAIIVPIYSIVGNVGGS